MLADTPLLGGTEGEGSRRTAMGLAAPVRHLWDAGCRAEWRPKLPL